MCGQKLGCGWSQCLTTGG